MSSACIKLLSGAPTYGILWADSIQSSTKCRDHQFESAWSWASCFFLSLFSLNLQDCQRYTGSRCCPRGFLVPFQVLRRARILCALRLSQPCKLRAHWLSQMGKFRGSYWERIEQIKDLLFSSSQFKVHTYSIRKIVLDHMKNRVMIADKLNLIIWVLHRIVNSCWPFVQLDRANSL